MLKLKTFDGGGRVKNGVPAININERGIITLNCALVELVAASGNIHIKLHQSLDDIRDWYLSFESDGPLKIRRKNGKGGVVNSAIIAREVLRSTKTTKRSASFVVSTEAVEQDGIDYYPIITRNNIIKFRNQ